MTFLISFSAALSISLLVIIIFNALTIPRFREETDLEEWPSVSLLVPARNEESNISRCLKSLLAQDYPRMEIIVLDDQSTDDTASIIDGMIADGHNMRLLRGQPLPAEWLGKNWACHQLSEVASGEILIFTDADTHHARDAVRKTVATMHTFSAGLLSIFPQQITKTLAEKLVVPVVNLLLYSTLPLRFAYWFSSPALAAANGQWMAFTRTAYHNTGGHTAVKNKIVEDVEMSRLIKRQGERLMVMPGNNLVFCRMYNSWRGVWEGFSKNLFGLTGNTYSTFFVFLFVLFFACVFPYIAVFFAGGEPLLLAALIANLLLRSVLALRFKLPFISGVLLHPFGVLFTQLIAFNSMIKSRTGKLTWRNRTIALHGKAETG